jgi:hypothetical protein
VSGPLLIIKAKEFAKKLSGEEFVCSAGWIDRFKLRHNISFGKVSGKASGVISDTTIEWLTAVWPNVREGFAANDIFNADEKSKNPRCFKNVKVCRYATVQTKKHG